jgi:hypothetical protein
VSDETVASSMPRTSVRGFGWAIGDGTKGQGFNLRFQKTLQSHDDLAEVA